MRLSRPTVLAKHFIRTLQLAAYGAVLLIPLLPAASAHAASSVRYTVTPASGSIRPNDSTVLSLSVTTDVAIAGVSIHLGFTNSGYAGFESAGNPALSFVDYHPDQADVVVICNNNNCGPGTYAIANITVTAGGAGKASVSFTPKETADPQLNLIAADGTTSTLDISSSAPAQQTKTTTKSTATSTFTIPKDDGSGGTTPQQVDGETFTDQTFQAQGIDNPDATETGIPSSKKKIALIVIGVLVGLSVLAILIIKFIGGNRPSGPYGGGGSGGSASGGPPVIFTR